MNSRLSTLRFLLGRAIALAVAGLALLAGYSRAARPQIAHSGREHSEAKVAQAGNEIGKKVGIPAIEHEPVQAGALDARQMGNVAAASERSFERPAAERLESSGPGATVIHVAQRGETLPGLVHRFLPASSYMTGSELEDAIRAANTDVPKVYLKAGETLRLPGMDAPTSERPLGISRDFEVRAIYLTGIMAGSARGLDLVRRWRSVGGNAVVFDIKDSDGIVNIPFTHPLNTSARRGPTIRNLAKYNHWLHQQGMIAIGRVAVFKDERMVSQHPELAVRSRSSGAPWRENGKLVWTDSSRHDVQEYNIELAEAAATAGVDEIQFDYVRFPAEGNQADAQFMFQQEHPGWRRSDVITDFVAHAYRELKTKGVLLSLDVFGVVAWQRPADLAGVGQDIPRMAQNCDVLSPMIYPSHFFGMDGYAFPGDAPEHFISESMRRFQQITAGSGVVLRPWLQAFGWRTKTYSPEYVELQVRVARAENGLGFLLWNARNDYSQPYLAMAAMSRAPEKYFRGGEVPDRDKAGRSVAAVQKQSYVGSPARPEGGKSGSSGASF